MTRQAGRIVTANRARAGLRPDAYGLVRPADSDLRNWVAADTAGIDGGQDAPRKTPSWSNRSFHRFRPRRGSTAQWSGGHAHRGRWLMGCRLRVARWDDEDLRPASRG